MITDDNWTTWAVWAAIAVYAAWELRNWRRWCRARRRRVELRREWAEGSRPGSSKSRRPGGPPRTSEYISGGRDENFYE